MENDEKLVERRGRCKNYDIIVRTAGDKIPDVPELVKQSCFILPVHIIKVEESRNSSNHWIRHVNYRYAALEFILAGRIRYTWDGVTREAVEGDIFFISHKSNSHYIRNPEGGEVHKVNIIFDGSLLGIFLRELGLGEDRLFHPEHFEEYLGEVSKIGGLMAEGDAGSECTASGVLCAMLYRLAGLLWAERKLPPCNGFHMETLLENLRCHLDNPLDNNELADALNVGRTTSHKRFVERCGMPPHRFMRQLRLDQAKELLLASELPVGVIAEQCGFPDLQYFITLFRKEYGLPPGKFRAKHLSESRNAPPEDRSSLSPR